MSIRHLVLVAKVLACALVAIVWLLGALSMFESARPGVATPAAATGETRPLAVDRRSPGHQRIVPSGGERHPRVPLPGPPIVAAVGQPAGDPVPLTRDERTTREEVR